jgi:hypothetical protein
VHDQRELFGGCVGEQVVLDHDRFSVALKASEEQRLVLCQQEPSQPCGRLVATHVPTRRDLTARVRGNDHGTDKPWEWNDDRLILVAHGQRAELVAQQVVCCF